MRSQLLGIALVAMAVAPGLQSQTPPQTPPAQPPAAQGAPPAAAPPQGAPAGEGRGGQGRGRGPLGGQQAGFVQNPGFDSDAPTLPADMKNGVLIFSKTNGFRD